MSRRFKVTFTTSAQLLPTIVELLTREVGRLGIEEVEEEKGNPNRPFPRRGSSPVGLTNERVPKLVLEALADGPQNLTQLGATLVSHGYKPRGASPACSKLIRAGLIQRVGPATYQLTKN